MTDVSKKHIDGAGLSHLMSLIKDDTAIVHSGSGERAIVTTDAADLPLLTLSPVLGESVQDGTPNPSAPVYIQAVRGRNLFDVSNFELEDNSGISFIDDETVRIAQQPNQETKNKYYVPSVHSGLVLSYVCTTKTVTDTARSKFTISARDSSGTHLAGTTVTLSTEGFTQRRYFTIPAGTSYLAFGGWAYSGSVYLTEITLAHAGNLPLYAPKGLLPIRASGRNLYNDRFSEYIKTSNNSYRLFPLNLTYGETYCLWMEKTGTDNPPTTMGLVKSGTEYSFNSTLVLSANSSSVRHTKASPYVFTVDDTFITPKLVVWAEDETVWDTIFEDVRVMLEHGSTPTDYEPYQSHTAYIDLKGHELHGLDSTYYDQLDIDASGHAVITKRTATTGFDAPWSFVNTNSNRTAIRTQSLDAVKYEQSVLPAILSNMHAAHKYADAFHDGYIGINSSGYLLAGFDSSYTTLASIIEAYPNLSITYPLDPAYWHTVDLGYVDLPQVTDGSTVHVAAEVQPIIGGTWWTKAGEGAGTAHADTDARIDAQLGSHTVASDVPADAVFTDTKALGSMTGTLGIDHGGTGATTAAGAANAIFGGLPTWTADPTDNTYLPRQDTGGGASYGKVKFSTVWNYIKSKISSWMKNNTDGAQSLGWVSVANDTMPVTSNTIAYWNGAYNSNNNSNLAYCSKGEFGTMATKNSLSASDIPSHASSATTYGAGSGSNYGHVKLSDSTSASTDTTGGTAATPKAVKAAYDLANGANTTAGQALSAATGALAFKVTYSVSGSDVVCAAHVYSAGQEKTNDHNDSCFVWSMSLDGGSTWTSLGTGKTKTVSAMSTYGGNVKCDFTPAS